MSMQQEPPCPYPLSNEQRFGCRVSILNQNGFELTCPFLQDESEEKDDGTLDLNADKCRFPWVDGTELSHEQSALSEKSPLHIRHFQECPLRHYWEERQKRVNHRDRIVEKDGLVFPMKNEEPDSTRSYKFDTTYVW
jgi:hypothetical protein